MDDSFIISGPKINNVPQNESLGQYLIGCLRKRESNDPLFIDAATGKVETCGTLLKDVVRAVQILKNFGLKQDDVITIVSENNIKYHVLLLAAFCMGVIVNPLNPAYSVDELRNALQTYKPKVVISSFTAYEKLEKLRIEFDFINAIVLMEPPDECETNQSVVSLRKLLAEIGDVDCGGFVPATFDVSQQGAFILLSSGTTGLPKGALLTHQNFRHSLSYLDNQECGALSSGDMLALVLPYFHIYGFLMSFSAIHLQTKVLVFSKLQVDLLLYSIKQYNVNVFHVVSYLLYIFVDNNILQNCDLTSIKEILVGGSPVSSDEILEMKQRLPNVNFREVYGMTEATGACSFINRFPKKPNCVGHLIPNIQAKIWDSFSGSNLGCMEAGEVCFKGPMIMKNYWENSNNIHIKDDDEFYHSGDLGYYDKNGLLYIIGRIKDVIKYKGFQVSPAEIELVLMLHTGVKDCAVVGVPDKKTGQVALAFVVRKTDCNATSQEFVNFVAERISVQKQLHGGVRFIDKIPRNTIGKILRKNLQDLHKANEL